MKITTVSYGHLFNLGNYENERIEASAYIEDFEDPADSLAEIRAWVMEQGTREKRQRAAETTTAEAIAQRSDELIDLEREITALNDRIRAARAFLAKTGIPEPDSWGDDTIPF